MPSLERHHLELQTIQYESETDLHHRCSSSLACFHARAVILGTFEWKTKLRGHLKVIVIVLP